MSSNNFFIKQDDTSPELEVTLYDEEGGNLINLLGSTVVFNMRNKNTGEVKVARGSCTLVDAENGVVKYPWQSGDTEDFGAFYGEFEVTYADSSVETFPNRNYIIVLIGDDIG